VHHEMLALIVGYLIIWMDTTSNQQEHLQYGSLISTQGS